MVASSSPGREHGAVVVSLSKTLYCSMLLFTQEYKCDVNPLGTVGGYSSNFRDATGPVEVYRRIPTSTQVTCIAAECIRVHALCINSADMYMYTVRICSCKISDYQHLGSTRQSTQLAAWQTYRQTAQCP